MEQKIGNKLKKEMIQKIDELFPPGTGTIQKQPTKAPGGIMKAHFERLASLATP